MRKYVPVLSAALAALCYGVSAPLAKLLQAQIPPAMMAALLYLGAGVGMSVVRAVNPGRQKELKLAKSDLPFVCAMVLLDIAAPLLLMFGLSLSNASTASLLGNFEIVATSVIALVFFQEAIGKRMWFAIAVITAASILLSMDGAGEIRFSAGSLLILAASICWGIENNCTRALSGKDPLQIVIVKGYGSGTGALIIVLITGGFAFHLGYILATMLLGFVAYGMSIYFYVKAQRHIGAARTSAYYAIAPFVGAALSIKLFGDRLTITFLSALALMLFGAYLVASEKHSHMHVHLKMEHEHQHRYDDGHHTHVHDPLFVGEHSHPHTHGQIEHVHDHMPDLHHTHRHQ